MRIVSGSTDMKVGFVASTGGARVTGLSSFTVYRSRNGGTATAMTTPTIAELDATNMPGEYVLTLDEDTTIDAGHDTEQMLLSISEAGMDRVTIAVELYRPETTAGQTLTVTSGVATANTTQIEGSDATDQINAACDTAISDAALATAASIAALNNLAASDIFTAQMTESYAANGVEPTLAQALYAIHQFLMSFSISSTSYTVNRLDNVGTAFVGTLTDDTNPVGNKRL